MARRCDFQVFDSDNHLYETRAAFTRHLPDRCKRVIDYVEVRGRTKIVVRGTISEFIPNPTFDVVARPGAQEEYFRVGNPEGKSFRELVGEPMRSIPAFREPVITLSIVDKAIEELEWAVERGARVVLIRPAAVPCPGGSRSFAFPEFDPFWQAVVDAGVLVAMHASDSGYSRYVGHLPPGLPEEDVAKVMGGNLARLVGVPVAV